MQQSSLQDAQSGLQEAMLQIYVPRKQSCVPRAQFCVPGEQVCVPGEKLVKLPGPQPGYVERLPADDKPGLGRPGRNPIFNKIVFWTGTRPCTLEFQAAHDAPIFKISIFWKFI